MGGTAIAGHTIDDATMLDAVTAWVAQTELICPTMKVGGTQVKVYWTERTSSSKKIRLQSGDSITQLERKTLGNLFPRLCA